jgi:hypothetical protein
MTVQCDLHDTRGIYTIFFPNIMARWSYIDAVGYLTYHAEDDESSGCFNCDSRDVNIL